jgi:hypothetical protein
MYLDLYKKKDHHQLDANSVANAISTLVMGNILMMAASIHNKIKLHYKYKISYDKAWIAKQKVFEHLFDSIE